MSYNDSSGSNRGVVLFVILAVGAGLLYFGTQGNPLSKYFGDNTTKISTATLSIPTSNITSNNTLLVVPDNDTDGVFDSIDLCPGTPKNDTITDSDGCGETQINPTKFNACGKNAFGKPDLSGTNDAGKGCTDFQVNDRDTICTANPPKNYDGVIIGVTSNPQLYCCYIDGNCQWDR